MRIALASLLLVLAPAAGAAGKACSLATPGEIEAATGLKVTFTPAMTMPTGIEACSGKAGPGSVILRTFRRTGDAEARRENDELEKLRKAGQKVEVQRSGAITCVAIEAAASVSTSCTAAKPPHYAVIEVTSPKKMPLDKLRALAEKMRSRL